MAKLPLQKSSKDKAPVKKDDAQDLSINREEDWQKIQSQWMKERVEKVEAYADRYFMTDDELPLHKHMLLVLMFVFFVVAILWASFASLDITARGEGQVIPSSKIQSIQNLEGGIIQAFFVKEGDRVEKGQLLVRLTDVGAQSDLGTNEAKYWGLAAGIVRLQAEVKGASTVEFSKDMMEKAPESVAAELRAFAANKDKLNGQTLVLEQQLSQRRQEVNELTRHASDLRGVIALSHERKNMVAPLIARGSAPKIEAVQIEQEIRERQTELNGLTLAIPRANSAIAEAQARIQELKKTAVAQAQMELAAKTAEMNTVQQTLGALEDRKDRTEILSPVKGIVKDFKINTVGGVVRPGDPILEVVPLDDQLIVEAKIKPQDIARLTPGMKATVKFTAYDWAVYGGLKGEVTDISADTIKNEKGESFYRVRVRTYENQLKRKGEVLPIIPGMVTTVDILTGERTVMQYLLKPVAKTLEYSMHEK